MMSASSSLHDELVLRKIHEIRGQKVMLDQDLAELYEVKTKRINEQVKRNPRRFPEGFMFRLTDHEWEELKAQEENTTAWGGRRNPPVAFTEHGVLMLSNVLNSDEAIDVSVRIIKVFTLLRERISDHEKLLEKLEELEGKDREQDERIESIFDYIKELREKKRLPSAKEAIGYKRPTRK